MLGCRQDDGVPLWNETVPALPSVLFTRRDLTESNNQHLVFTTEYGAAWSREAIFLEFGKGLGSLTLYRRGLAFSSLRKTFRQ